MLVSVVPVVIGMFTNLTCRKGSNIYNEYTTRNFSNRETIPALGNIVHEIRPPRYASAGIRGNLSRRNGANIGR